MEEVLKLVGEERDNLEALIQEKGENGTTKEISLLHSKWVKINDIEKVIKEYNSIK